MADVGRLLEFIVRNRQFRLERTIAEMETRANQTPEIVFEPGTVREEEVQAARAHQNAFARGLYAAWCAHEQGGAPLELDDRDPEQNAQAEALILYLVRPNLASVETEQVAPEHYRYRLQVDWPVLRGVADRAGVDLDRILA